MIKKMLITFTPREFSQEMTPIISSQDRCEECGGKMVRRPPENIMVCSACGLEGVDPTFDPLKRGRSVSPSLNHPTYTTAYVDGVGLIPNSHRILRKSENADARRYRRIYDVFIRYSHDLPLLNRSAWRFIYAIFQKLDNHDQRINDYRYEIGLAIYIYANNRNLPISPREIDPENTFLFRLIKKYKYYPDSLSIPKIVLLFLGRYMPNLIPSEFHGVLWKEAKAFLPSLRRYVLKFQGKRPAAVAGALIYFLARNRLRIGISQKEVASIVQTTPISLRKHYRTLKAIWRATQ
jgi:ribosomal protein L37AE/L43A